MPPTTITEGEAKLLVHQGKISKKLPVFYNPDMTLNRDLSVLLLAQHPNAQRVLDLLSASGARAIRLAKETPCGDITANDYDKKAVELIKKNAALNKAKITIEHKEANTLLATSQGWDYIDIDPYGSPNPYLDQSIQHLSRKGILAVTATDTSALCGTYINACARKYWSTPMRNHLMHEVGMRILIRKIQLVGAQYDKLLHPVFVHSTKHYMRAYFMNLGKGSADTVKTLHQYIHYNKDTGDTSTHPQNTTHGFTPCATYHCTTRKHHRNTNAPHLQVAGPLYIGNLWQDDIVRDMLKEAKEGSDAKKLLKLISSEMKIPTLFFHDIHKLCKEHKLSVPPSKKVFDAIKKKKEKVSLTHFNHYGIKTTMKGKELVKLLKKLQY